MEATKEDIKLEFVKGSVKDLEEIVELNHEIFKGIYKHEPYSLEQYKEKLKDKEPLIYLIRFTDPYLKFDNKLIGDSIAFEKDKSWYIWIMAVADEFKWCNSDTGTFRHHGYGTRLFELNEEFAKENSYKSVTVKVYNVSKGMQFLCLKRNYHVVGVEPAKDPKQTAVHFKKRIKR